MTEVLIWLKQLQLYYTTSVQTWHLKEKRRAVSILTLSLPDFLHSNYLVRDIHFHFITCTNALASQWLVFTVSIKMLYCNSRSRLDELNINSGWQGAVIEYSLTACIAPRILPNVKDLPFLFLSSTWTPALSEGIHYWFVNTSLFIYVLQFWF